MSALVSEVIDLSLSQSKLDASFGPLARKHYNSIIRDQSKNFDWPFWRIVGDVTPFLIGKTAYDVPDNYSRSDFCYNYSATNQQGAPILITSPMRYEQLRAVGVSSGTPRYAMIDQTNKEILFECVPSSGGYKLSYFRKGTEIDVAGGNDNDEIDWEDDMWLIKAITARLMEYTDDQRQDQKAQAADKKLVEVKRNVYDNDDDSKIELARATYKAGRRPTRGGGGWGGWGGVDGQSELSHDEGQEIRRRKSLHRRRVG
jgi:hypothetical protein